MKKTAAAAAHDLVLEERSKLRRQARAKGARFLGPPELTKGAIPALPYLRKLRKENEALHKTITSERQYRKVQDRINQLMTGKFRNVREAKEEIAQLSELTKSFALKQIIKQLTPDPLPASMDLIVRMVNRMEDEIIALRKKLKAAGIKYAS